MSKLNSRESSLWSVGEGYQVEHEMIRFASHDAKNEVAAGQTVCTILATES